MINIKKIFFIVGFFLFLLPVFNGLQAGFFQFDQTTATTTNGGTFQISVNVDPGSDALNGAEAYVVYDASLLKATAVSAGSLFPDVQNDISTSGKVWIAGLVLDPASSVSTAGTLGTITFQGLKDGSGTLSFDCAASKIVKNDIDVTNVINCSQNNTSSVTIGSGSSGVDPTPTTSTNNNPPSELPQSGVLDNVVKFGLPGILLLILGGVLRLILL